MAKIRKILRINREIYEKIKAEAIVFKRWLTGLAPRQRKAREKQVEGETKTVTINGAAYYRDYVPTNIWPTRDSRLWQWRMVEEWYNDLNDDPVDNGQERRIDLSPIVRGKMRLKSFIRRDRGLVHINPWTKS